jgi:hypothetical protein
VVGLVRIELTTSALSGRLTVSVEVPLDTNPSLSVLVRGVSDQCLATERDAVGLARTQLLGQSWDK